MTQEIKDRLEQAAEKCADRDQIVYTLERASYFDGFTAGAQTILENPHEWGLCSLEVLEATSVSVGKAWADNDRLKSQLAKYREALERVRKIVIYDLSEPIQEVIDVVEGVLYEGE